ncbi:MAG: carbamoyl phosphate synthase small subunit [Peptococcaceae bacterium]|jgi:carbamoyl-phosphate synthase small subunit|nr:carbamoyl phosphate synthase small subunit [Peptococcaceae bacterium]
MNDKIYLTLENGKIFEGKRFGAEGEVVGELVFTTGMTGYLETLTDKSYYGQIIAQTFPLIGNYGVIPEDFEGSRVYARGYIVRQGCREPSNFRSEGDLDAFLKTQNIVGLRDIDTRELTKIIRQNGVMNGKISRELTPGDMEEIRAFRIEDAVAGVSVRAPYVQAPGGRDGGGARFRVALLDLGLKENIKRELVKRNCEVTVYPYDTKAEGILGKNPDGIMLSNGPGDPAENVGVIRELRKLAESGVPIFGICLGHQLLALARGFRTEKLKYGHRGANQPAKNLLTGRTYITSQNHGYAVVSDSIDPGRAQEWFVNVNDRTCEGILYRNTPIFSVQFHPEACGGPRDTSFLFDQFMDMMEVRKHASEPIH